MDPARQATRKLGAAPQRTSDLRWGPAATKQGATQNQAAVGTERDTYVRPEEARRGANLYTQLGAGSTESEPMQQGKEERTQKSAYQDAKTGT